MVFSSMTFLLLFLPVLLLAYFLAGSIPRRNAVLLTASLLFYAWGEPVCVLAMLFSSAVNWLCGLAIDRADSPRARKHALLLGAAVSLGLLIYFKYFSFLLSCAAALFRLKLTVPRIRLPVGISFYTFQVLTYTVDVYRGKAPVQRSFSRLLLYVSCFPQLIAGPIVQYSDIARELEERTVTVEDFTDGMGRFAVGLSKKVLLANICGAAVDAMPHAGTGAALSLFGAWYLAFLYSLQLYFDFSAYSDMAIGLGRVLGFHYKENFDYPYVSRSASEFWRRWHISLGSFFRDYVYIPLGGNRRGMGRTALNILVVWSLTGFWHGAGWNFLLWGFYFGVILLLERSVLKGFLEKTPPAVRWLLTWLVVLVGWDIFYYTDAAALQESLWALIGLSRSPEGAFSTLPLLDEGALTAAKQYSLYPLAAFALSLPMVPGLKKRLSTSPWGARLVRGLDGILPAALLALSVVFLVGQSYNPFIYFRF